MTLHKYCSNTCFCLFFQQTPRGKWNCPGCNQKTPKKCKSKKGGLSSTHLLQPPDVDDSSTNHSMTSLSKEETPTEEPVTVDVEPPTSTKASKKNSPEREPSPPPTPTDSATAHWLLKTTEVMYIYQAFSRTAKVQD